MASSSVAISPPAQQDWRKMNKQALRDALASRGLDTNGLRPSLIQRLESSVKAAAEALATSVADGPSKSTTERQEEEGLTQIESQSEEATQTLEADTNLAPTDTSISKPQEKKRTQESSNTLQRDVGEVKATAENGKSEHIFSNTARLSDLEKKRLRAERFGVGLQVSEQEKLALRAERFSGADGKKSVTAREPESERRRQRAARFGIADEESRKKARQERFATTLKQNRSTEVDKRVARAARFGAASEQTGSKEKE